MSGLPITARDLLRQYPALRHGRALWVERLERETRPEYAELLLRRLEDDDRITAGVLEAVKILDPIEQRIIARRYLSSDNCRCTPWRTVFLTVYGSDSAAHQRAGYRAHRSALDKLQPVLMGAGLLE